MLLLLLGASTAHPNESRPIGVLIDRIVKPNERTTRVLTKFLSEFEMCVEFPTDPRETLMKFADLPVGPFLRRNPLEG